MQYGVRHDTHHCRKLKTCASGCYSVSAWRYCPAITVSFRYGLLESAGSAPADPFCHKAPGCIRYKLSARLSSAGCFLCVPLTATCSLQHFYDLICLHYSQFIFPCQQLFTNLSGYFGIASPLLMFHPVFWPCHAPSPRPDRTVCQCLPNCGSRSGWFFPVSLA